MEKSGGLETGEVGYIVTGLRDVSKARVGDTITTQTKTDLTHGADIKRVITGGPPKSASSQQQSVQALPGYKQVKPMVYATIFPVSVDD